MTVHQHINIALDRLKALGQRAEHKNLFGRAALDQPTVEFFVQGACA